jgi:predicted aspartyl protease
MMQGYFDGNVPMISVTVGSGQAAQAPFVVLDTGFTGDLQVTPEVAKELGLVVSGIEKMRVADGRIVDVPTALTFVELEGIKKYVQVLISKSSSLAGISLLSRFQYKAMVDCKYKTVILEKSI